MRVRSRRSTRVVFTLFTVLLGLQVALSRPEARARSVEETTRSVQRALQNLPRYGVFDFLAFSVERGTVTLVGYAYDGQLKSAAEHAAKRVAGVDEVANKVQLLPASIGDDRIRRATFYRIYTDASLSRYTPGGPMHARDEALRLVRFPGMQPFGAYPIHIIVANGRTTLLGTVANAADKQIAAMRAREVGGVFAVANELVVEVR